MKESAINHDIALDHYDLLAAGGRCISWGKRQHDVGLSMFFEYLEWCLVVFTPGQRCKAVELLILMVGGRQSLL